MSERAQNDLYEELIQWDTKKLYTILSRDGGKTFAKQRIVHFVYDFIIAKYGKDVVSEDEWEEINKEACAMMPNIKQKAIAIEMKILGYVLGER